MEYESSPIQSNPFLRRHELHGFVLWTMGPGALPRTNETVRRPASWAFNLRGKSVMGM